MKLSLPGFLASALAVAALATLGTAQILRLDLSQMIARTTDTVRGKIAARDVVQIDHPVDGTDMYFTTLTIEGRSLETGKPLTVKVSYAGGFVDAEHGSFNSEAPSADDSRVGNDVVVFFQSGVNLGGGFVCNEVLTWHGGLYRTFERKGDVIVQGRGDGYAIPANVRLSDLSKQISTLAQSKEQPR